MNTKIDRNLLIILTAWVILAIIFAFMDLEISKVIFNGDNILGTFGAKYGEWPGIAILCISFGIMIVTIVKGNYGTPLTKTVIIIILLYFINALLFVQTTKYFWGRVRFMHLLDDFSNYTPWYVINGYNGHASFVSAHSAMAWLPLPLINLTTNLKAYLKYPIAILIMAWGLLISISRIIIGTHYPSDILFPTFIAITITYISMKYIKFNTFTNPSRFGLYTLNLIWTLRVIEWNMKER